MNKFYPLVTLFFKRMEDNFIFSLFLSKWNGKRGPKRRLSLEQVVALKEMSATPAVC
ncbi:MAG: hypothetical protein PUE30_03410 [Spirochaetia bacterium]|nr:hypothetical protein [Spirochaetia bacterium]